MRPDAVTQFCAVTTARQLRVVDLAMGRARLRHRALPFFCRNWPRTLVRRDRELFRGEWTTRGGNASRACDVSRRPPRVRKKETKQAGRVVRRAESENRAVVEATTYTRALGVAYFRYRPWWISRIDVNSGSINRWSFLSVMSQV